jgi:hypothetical protein
MVDFCQTTRHYTPEDTTTHSHYCENLEFNNIKMDLEQMLYKMNGFEWNDAECKVGSCEYNNKISYFIKSIKSLENLSEH